MMTVASGVPIMIYSSQLLITPNELVVLERVDLWCTYFNQPTSTARLDKTQKLTHTVDTGHRVEGTQNKNLTTETEIQRKP